VTFAGTVDANTYLEVWASPFVSTGKQFVKNLMRYIGTFGAGPTSPISITTPWQAVFGDLPDASGYRIVAECNFLNSLNGARTGRVRGDLLG